MSWKPYSPEEEQQIRQSYQALGPTALAKAMGRTPGALVAKGCAMGLASKNEMWTMPMVTLLRRYGAKLPMPVLERELGRNQQQIERKADQLGVRLRNQGVRYKPGRLPLSPQELEAIWLRCNGLVNGRQALLNAVQEAAAEKWCLELLRDGEPA